MAAGVLLDTSFLITLDVRKKSLVKNFTIWQFAVELD